MALVGEHAAATWKDVNFRPASEARLSTFGVEISDP